MASPLRQSPTGWILGRPVYPAVHRLGGWRSWNQPRSAPRLGVKKRPPRVRSHGLQGRIACNGRETLNWPMWDPSSKVRHRTDAWRNISLPPAGNKKSSKEDSPSQNPSATWATPFLSSTICQKILLALGPLWTQKLVNCYQPLTTLA